MIHGYYLWWGPLLAAYLNLCRVAFVITPHGSLAPHQQSESVAKKKVFEFMTANAYRSRARGFVTGSQNEADNLALMYPDVSVFVGGVGTALPGVHKNGEKLGSPITLLTLSRIAEVKRLDLCLRALYELTRRGHSAQLVIAGDGDSKLKARLLDLARELGVDTIVFWPGHVEGKAKEKLFLEADIFLMPSSGENFGIGLAEATAFGLPSVTSAAVAAAACLSPEFCRTIPEPTGPAIAEEVVRLTDSQFSERQRAARLAAEEVFSWKRPAENWASALRICLNSVAN